MTQFESTLSRIPRLQTYHLDGSFGHQEFVGETVQSGDDDDVNEELDDAEDASPLHHTRHLDDAEDASRPRHSQHRHMQSSAAVKFSGIKMTLTDINKKRASDPAVLANGAHSDPELFRFKCPAPSCRCRPVASTVYKDFAEHVLTHSGELYAIGVYQCPFGCPHGFLDAIAQRTHIIKCPRTPPVLGEEAFKPDGKVCGWKGCNIKFTSTTTLYAHWLRRHSDEEYENPNIAFKDDTCERGFRDARAYYSHIIQTTAVGSHTRYAMDGYPVSLNIVYLG